MHQMFQLAQNRTTKVYANKQSASAQLGKLKNT